VPEGIIVSTSKRSPTILATTSPRIFVVTTIDGFSTLTSSALDELSLDALLLDALLLDALLLDTVLLALSLLLQALANNESVAMNTVISKENRFRNL
tara:strand:+ start:278 stop:568 length:291 start_codon:yes stop_codon:yes gene_type:complete